jgi:nitrate/TMAO reductase-like tetraheme cytochrome c subunit
VFIWLLALSWSVRAASPAAPAGQATAKPAAPAATPPPTADDCLACHDDADLKREKAGTSVTVKNEVFAASIHGPLACVDCHSDLAHAELPHAEKLAKVDCSSCHADQVTQYKQSAHAAARAGGSDVAATCASCHGMHDIRGS